MLFYNNLAGVQQKVQVGMCAIKNLDQPAQYDQSLMGTLLVVRGPTVLQVEN